MNLLFALLLAAAATQPPNTVSIGAGTAALPTCGELNKCILTGSTSATATFFFGADVRWCSTAIVAPKYPVVVNYAPPNPALCATDPASGSYKVLLAVMQAAPYDVNFTIAGTPYKVTIPALPPPPPTVVSTSTCNLELTIQHMSDGSNNLIGPFSCK